MGALEAALCESLYETIVGGSKEDALAAAAEAAAAEAAAAEAAAAEAASTAVYEADAEVDATGSWWWSRTVSGESCGEPDE